MGKTAGQRRIEEKKIKMTGERWMKGIEEAKKELEPITREKLREINDKIIKGLREISKKVGKDKNATKQ